MFKKNKKSHTNSKEQHNNDLNETGDYNSGELSLDDEDEDNEVLSLDDEDEDNEELSLDDEDEDNEELSLDDEDEDNEELSLDDENEDNEELSLDDENEDNEELSLDDENEDNEELSLDDEDEDNEELSLDDEDEDNEELSLDDEDEDNEELSLDDEDEDNEEISLDDEDEDNEELSLDDENEDNEELSLDDEDEDNEELSLDDEDEDNEELSLDDEDEDNEEISLDDEDEDNEELSLDDEDKDNEELSLDDEDEDNCTKDNNTKKSIENKKTVKNTNLKNKKHNLQSEKNVEILLLEQGLISQDQLNLAYKIKKEKKSNNMIGAMLVELGFITGSILSNALSSQDSENTDISDITPANIDFELIKIIPKDIAKRYKILPITMRKNTLYLATTDIYDITIMDKVKKYLPTNHTVKPVYVLESEIIEIIEQYYGYDMSIDGIFKEIESSNNLDEKKVQKLAENNSYTSPTVRLVDAILMDAIKKRTSDIHFEPEKDFIRLRYRIDGRLLQILSFHKEYWSAVVVRIKIMATMNIAETRIPQDGAIEYQISGKEIDLRVATQPTVYGENIVLRILDKKHSLVSMDKLGYSKNNQNLIKKMLKKPEGIIIVTGPTGSGKTTTLYSMLNHINSINVNIMTLEDPVEYRLPIIRQTNVTSNMGFASGVRSVMRQDPDIVFVGEVRDDETATSAIRLASTGHQVFTTLHTNDAIGAINRLLDIGIKQHMLSGSLICIIAQRLVRKLCDKCKIPYNANAEDCKILGLKSSVKIYKHNGCDECMNLGYSGRIAISEILPVDKIIDEMLSLGNFTRNQMVQHAKTIGFIPMNLDGILKVIKGVTDIDEIIRVIDMTDRL